MHKFGRSAPYLLHIYEKKLLINSLDINVPHPAVWKSHWFCRCLQEDHKTQKLLISAAQLWDGAGQLGWVTREEGGKTRGAVQWEPGLSFLGFWSKRLRTKWVVRSYGKKLFDDKWQPALRMKRRKTDERSRKRILRTYEYVFFLLAHWRNTQRNWMTHLGSYNPQDRAVIEPSSPHQLHNGPFKRLLPSFFWSQLAGSSQHNTSAGLISSVATQSIQWLLQWIARGRWCANRVWPWTWRSVVPLTLNT